MTFTWEAVVYLLALICFVLAALGKEPPRVGLVALGLALWVLVVFLNAAGVH